MEGDLLLCVSLTHPSSLAIEGLFPREGFWMSDKPLVQQALATEIAEILLHIQNTTASLAFLRGFWEATVREWAGIDRLR